MYSYIKGTLAEISEGTVVVENQGIGYNILATGPLLNSLPPIGGEIKVYTYTYVREDQLALFGFLTRDELSVFKLLIAVSGIGLKGAVAILSAMDVDDLRFAVLGDDVKAFEKVPGIGKKTAQRLIIELKDKLDLEEVFEDALHQRDVSTPSGGKNDLRSEAVLALTALGYGSQEALKAVQSSALDENTTVESLLKEALRYL